MANILGSALPTISGGNISRATLELVFKNNAILLNDGLSLGLSAFDSAFGTNLGGSAFGDMVNSVSSVVALTLLGFVYDNPSSMELLKYSYSEYPYLNKSLIVNSYLKENTRFTIRAYKAITPDNTIPINYIYNEQIYSQLKNYCDYGGTFTLMTLWGSFSNLVLESLNSVYPEGSEVGGVGFEFNFLKPNFDGSSSSGIVSKAINALTSGFF